MRTILESSVAFLVPVTILTAWALEETPQSGRHLVGIWPYAILERVDLAAQLARPLPQAASAIRLR